VGRIFLAVAMLALTGGLGGCDVSDAALQSECVDNASKFLDPAWAPRTVGNYAHATLDVSLTITAQGRTVKIDCPMRVSEGFAQYAMTIQGRIPEPGQLFMPAKNRWLTKEELAARVKQILTIQPAEFSGQKWQAGTHAYIAEAEGETGPCFWMRSNLNPDRAIQTCPMPDRRHFWMSQDFMVGEVDQLPPGLPPIPKSDPSAG
jgi:hypothetical protein